METTSGQIANDDDQIHISKDIQEVTSDRADFTEDKTPGENDNQPEYLTRFKLVLVHVSITIACFLMLVDTSIVATALPRITNEFHSLPDVGWYGSAYLLASCALQPMSGKLYSIFKLKQSFMCFLTLFELGSVLCGAASSSNMLIVGRAISGMGAAGILNGALVINATCAPLERRAALLAICLGLSQMGIVLGPLIGGALTEYTSWRWCFYINLPAGAVVALTILFINIPERAVTSTARASFIWTMNSLDLIGFLLFAPATIMFLLALQWGGSTYSWDNAIIVGLFCGSGVTLVIFISWESRRGDTAMVPLSILQKRIVLSCCLTMFFLTGNWLSTSYWMPVYFQAVKAKSPLMSGVYLLPMILSQILFGMVLGLLLSRLGYYLPWVVIGSAIASIGSGLLSTLTPETSTGKWVGYQFLGGVGRGMALQMPFIATQNAISAAEISVAMGILLFFQNLGGAFLLSLDQTIFSTGLRKALPHFAPSVDVSQVIQAGATGIRDVVPSNLLPGVLLAYNQAINHVFYLVTGAGVAGVSCSLFMGWKSVKTTDLTMRNKQKS